MLQEYYNMLDLNPGATTDEIKKAYRSKAKLYHPDTNKAPEAHFQFIRMKEAFEILLKIKHLENYRISQTSRFYHPHDPYFQSAHHHHRNAAYTQHGHGDKNDRNDFLDRKIGRTIYLSVHILFIITGFLIFTGPIYTLLTLGFNPYHTRADSIFAMVAGMTFGVIMIYKISSSFFRFLKKDI